MLAYIPYMDPMGYINGDFRFRCDQCGMTTDDLNTGRLLCATSGARTKLKSYALNQLLG